MDEKEGEACIDLIHKEFRNRGVEDPLAEAFINLNEDLFMGEEENAVIGKVLPYIPAIMHYSEYFQILYVKKGSFDFYTTNHKYRLKDGDVLIIPPRINRCFVLNDQDEVYTILIRSSTFDISFLNLVNKNDFLAQFFTRALYSTPVEYILWHCVNNLSISELIEKCYIEFTSNKKYKERMVEIILSELFISLIREETSVEKLPITPHRSNEDTMKILMDYLATHYQSASIADLAKLCNYSERQISRIIKNEAGVGFAELRNHFRLEKSCVLLKNSNLTIREIRKCIGFSSDSYFVKVFEKKYQVSPIEYKRRHV